MDNSSGTDYTKCVFLSVCAVSITISPSDGKSLLPPGGGGGAGGGSGGTRTVTFPVEYCEYCEPYGAFVERRCPNVVTLARQVVNATRQQLRAIILAIERTQKIMVDETEASGEYKYNITDFRDVNNRSSKLGRIVRRMVRKATPPGKLLLTSYVSLSLVQTYMSILEELQETIPVQLDMGSINNETRKARCNLLDHAKNLGVNKPTKKLKSLCKYKSQTPPLTSNSDITSYIVSVLGYGSDIVTRTLAEMEDLEGAVQGCEYKKCGIERRLGCGSGKKSARAMKKTKRRKGKKGRKGRKGKKGRKDRACRGKKSEKSRQRHESKKCKKSSKTKTTSRE